MKLSITEAKLKQQIDARDMQFQNGESLAKVKSD